VSRLPPQPGERVDRGRTLGFTFDGNRVEALGGDTIGSALYAAGQRTFSRSFKYHRRRGLLCCAGQCPNCLVQVDGAPGVRACTEPVREGMRVEHMNASPSLDFDVMRATDLVGGPFTPPGFYYKTFIRPRRLWPLYEKVLRHAAGLGRLKKSQAEREWRTEYRRRHADVLVVGGGAAGLAAASAAGELGVDVVLADEGPEPGGRLLAEGGREYARELTERARAAGVELLVSAPALGAFDGLVPVWQENTLHQVRARRHVYATGAIEQPLLFPGNDLPGVMLSGGARRLISLYAVKPGTRAVVATVCDRGLHAAMALLDAGVELVCVADLRENGMTAAGQALMRRGADLMRGATVLEARGRGQVQMPRRTAENASWRAICWWSPAAVHRPPHCSHRPARAPSSTQPAASSPSPSCRTACSPPVRCPGRGSSKPRSSRERWPGPRRRTRSASATPTPAQAPRADASGSPAARPGGRKRRCRRRSPTTGRASASPACART
jgi:sarcosine oxidase subunit alpha